ncbi:hypothetical protein AB0K43_23695 [Kitasatospora sp. NPDC049258]|uniref:hypothetical protein n=1 Tax=Kitasatospora sp. NPDC049258 TaxID=3155394 RepID=UPI0034361198
MSSSLVVVMAPEQVEVLAGRLRARGLVDRPPPDRPSIEWQGGSIGFDFSGRVLDDLEEEVVEVVLPALGDPFAVLVMFRSIRAVGTLLVEVLDGLTGYVDTNHGELLEIGAFTGLVGGHPGWDWRVTGAGEAGEAG